jgi:4-carboxy-3-alkylbut-2-enoyl-[acp] decarboxylase
MNDTVINLSEPIGGVACISMQDRVNKNTFTPELIQALSEAFEYIGQDEKYKAVILTGFDSYFASGGSQEMLLALHEGKGTFADTNFYSLALDCPIPVISAMQGHGIGGGFALGLFADFIILSRESIYTTNFMKYGFTPGMGATLILPEKLGLALSEEMLLMAETYRGERLKNRGVPFPVLPRNEVFERAIEIATSLTGKPRVSLVTLKHHLTRSIRERLPGVINQELKMHEQTFHQQEVRELIEERFVRGQGEGGHG